MQLKQATTNLAVDLDQDINLLSTLEEYSDSDVQTLSKYDNTINFINKNEKEKSIGIETCMVYIAIPVSIVMWSGIIYIITLVF
jgi:hypothetical protein